MNFFQYVFKTVLRSLKKSMKKSNLEKLRGCIYLSRKLKILLMFSTGLLAPLWQRGWGTVSSFARALGILLVPGH